MFVFIVVYSDWNMLLSEMKNGITVILFIKHQQFNYNFFL